MSRLAEVDAVMAEEHPDPYVVRVMIDLDAVRVVEPSINRADEVWVRFDHQRSLTVRMSFDDFKTLAILSAKPVEAR